MKITIEKGVVIKFKGADYTIERIVDTSKVVASHNSTKKIKVIKIEDIQDPENTSEDKLHYVVNYSEKEWAIAKKRFEIIKPILSSKSKLKTITEVCENQKLGQATIYRWINAYNQTGTLTSLIPPKKTGGKGKSRINKETNEIISDCIDQYYLNSQKKSIPLLIREINKMCIQSKLSCPSPNTIRLRINHISEEQRIKRRFGSKTADEIFNPIRGPFPGGKYPLEYVQIDHTLLDIILVDDTERKPLGRPWLTLAIDIFSRMVTGYYLSFDPPGAIGTGLCISNSILPKEKLLSSHNIKGEWPCWGIMKVIHADNAKEFRGKMLKKACEEYGIELDWRKVGSPHWGGHIERLLGTILKEIHNLPGSTFSKISDRVNYNSAAKSAFTLQEFEKWLLKFIVEIYHNKIHSSIGMSPLNKYKEGILGTKDQSGIGIPDRFINNDKVRLDFLPYFERSVQQYGIVIDHINYYHEVLRRWIKVKDDDGNLTKHFFKRDPRDISLVYFWDPELSKYFPIPYRNISKPSMSIWEYKKVISHLKSKNIDKLDEEKIFQAFEDLRELEKSAISKTRKKRKAKKNVEIPKIPIEQETSSLEPNTSELKIIKPFEIDDYESSR